MGGDWNTAPLSVLAELSGGFAFKSGDYVPSGRFILRTLNISDDCSINRDDAVYLPEELCPQYSRFELKAQDTLFVMVGATLGKIGFVREKDLPALLNQNMWLIRANPEMANPRFVHYAFRHAAKESLGWASGSARDFVRRDDYRNLKIPAPPLPEQRAIAHILGTLDDKIELNRRMNETLEAVAKALFKSWFVDFDPVCAKAEGRDPSLPKHIADLFPDSFEDSALGEIPLGWSEGVFSDLVEILSGGTPKTSVTQYWDGDILWYSVEDVPDGSNVFVIDTKRHITQAGVENSATQIMPEGTTIISARGTVGKLALTAFPMAMNQSCYGVRGAHGYPDFFTYYNLLKVVSELQQQTHGTVFETITRQTFTTVKALLPPITLAQAFDRQVEPLMNCICINLFESRTLAALRDTLLPKLISGEIRVKDAERFAAEDTKVVGELTQAIYTIGHSNHSIQSFINLLKRHNINAIADVRSSPVSKRNPQFNQAVLSAALKKENISYVFMGKELGGRPDDPRCYENGQANYLRMAEAPIFKEGIDRLLKGRDQHRIALLCAEKEPLDCHRTILISRNLYRLGIPIKHILADGSIEEHQDTESRLIKVTGLEPNLFDRSSSDSERIQQAYDKRAREIAYKPNHKEDNNEYAE